MRKYFAQAKSIGCIRKTALRIIDPLTVYIDRGVSIEGGTEIWPNTIITGETEIGADNLIIASRIDTCTIGNATISTLPL
jgi:bifunctional N-acetylglucosamine-1-phosphate-uridyltransferase/glucosamine-1-phosphate-acetyltransferase GlmU-like protein